MKSKTMQVIQQLKSLFFNLFQTTGSETTASTLQWIFAVLTNNPDIQDKVFHEIDAVVGRDRLPTADDGKPFCSLWIYDACHSLSLQNPTYLTYNVLYWRRSDCLRQFH
jgi:cytochrome P450